MPVGKSIIDIAKDVIQTEADSVLKLKAELIKILMRFAKFLKTVWESCSNWDG